MLKKQHLFEIDLMRACIIFSVICVHTLSFFDVHAPSGSLSKTGMDMLVTNFHYTREAFMLITGLVLFYTYYDRQSTILSFWRKRLTLIAIPYVVWTAIYIAFEGTYERNFSWSPHVVLPIFGTSLLTANQFFLYFLMVSMQFYVLFPLMLWLIRKLEHHLGWVFAVSFILEVVMMYINQTMIDTIHLKHASKLVFLLVHHRDEIIFTYQFWFVAGAIISVKYVSIRDWVWSHTRWVVASIVFFLLVLWSTYLVERHGLHFSHFSSVDALQPAMVPYSLVVSVGLWFIGLKWASVRTEARMHRVSAVIRFFGGVSFGIFLFHPIALHYLEAFSYKLHWHGPTHYLLIPVIAVLAYILSGFSAYFIGKVPYVSYIVGEKTHLHRRADKVPLTNAS